MKVNLVLKKKFTEICGPRLNLQEPLTRVPRLIAKSSDWADDVHSIYALSKTINSLQPRSVSVDMASKNPESLLQRLKV